MLSFHQLAYSKGTLWRDGQYEDQPYYLMQAMQVIDSETAEWEHEEAERRRKEAERNRR